MGRGWEEDGVRQGWEEDESALEEQKRQGIPY